GDPVSEVAVLDVGISEEARLDAVLRDEPREVLFREDRDSIRVERPPKGGGVLAALDSGDLRGRERDDAERRIVPEDDVEVVKIPARGAEDDDLARLWHGAGSRGRCKGFLHRGSFCNQP